MTMRLVLTGGCILNRQRRAGFVDLISSGGLLGEAETPGRQRRQGSACCWCCGAA